MIVTVTLNPVLDRTLTVPYIPFNQMIRATELRLDWGGKGFNVSRALHALGAQSTAMGLVGGATGQLLERGLRDLGIATDLLHISGETRTNTVIAEMDSGRYIKVNEVGPTVQALELSAFLARVHERVHPGDIWILSGSLPPGLPPNLYAQLIALLRKAGAMTFLDTSGEPLRLGCLAGPHLVKPNVFEAEEMLGQEINSDADALRAVKFFLQQGAELAALSLGADGLLLASTQQAIWASPPRVPVRNPVGAGDALLAGIAWAMEQAMPLEEIARWGVATGTAAATCEGVSVGVRAEVESLYAQVQTKLGDTGRKHDE
jgi:1-phosphofructokinase family hexose kinase